MLLNIVRDYDLPAHAKTHAVPHKRYTMNGMTHAMCSKLGV